MAMLEPLHALFDQFSAGLCVSDANGDVLYMNKSAELILDIRGDTKVRNACDLLCKIVELPSGRDANCDCPMRDPQDPAADVTLSGRLGPRSTFNWRDDRVTRQEVWRDIRVRCVRARLPSGNGDGQVHIILIEEGSPEAELRRHSEDWRTMIADLGGETEFVVALKAAVIAALSGGTKP